MTQSQRLDQLLKLSGLEVPPSERDGLLTDLDRIVSMMSTLQDLDLKLVPQWSPARVSAASLREDTPHTPFDRTAMMANTPEQEDGYYRVPKIVEDS